MAVCDFEVKGKEIEVVWERWLCKEGFTGDGPGGGGRLVVGAETCIPGRGRCLAVGLERASLLRSSGDRHGPEGQRTQL